MKKLLAFHGDPKIKAKYLARVRAHRKADEIIHGKYWEHGKGCAVGCTIHSEIHENYETELGIPQVLAYLEDSLFENLNNGDAKKFPEAFLRAPRVGADLSLVWPRFAVWMLTDSRYGVIQFSNSKNIRIAIQNVSDAYTRIIAGKRVTNWQELANATYSVASSASSAVYSAAYSAVRKRQAKKLLALMSECV